MKKYLLFILILASYRSSLFSQEQTTKFYQKWKENVLANKEIPSDAYADILVAENQVIRLAYLIEQEKGSWLGLMFRTYLDSYNRLREAVGEPRAKSLSELGSQQFFDTWKKIVEIQQNIFITPPFYVKELLAIENTATDRQTKQEAEKFLKRSYHQKLQNYLAARFQAAFKDLENLEEGMYGWIAKTKALYYYNFLRELLGQPTVNSTDKIDPDLVKVSPDPELFSQIDQFLRQQGEDISLKPSKTRSSSSFSPEDEAEIERLEKALAALRLKKEIQIS